MGGSDDTLPPTDPTDWSESADVQQKTVYRSRTVRLSYQFEQLKSRIGLDRSRLRLVYALVFVCLLAPVTTSGLTYSPISDASANTTATAQNVTFVSAQGRETGGGAGIYAINTDTKEVIWSHTRYAKKYFDVDPIENDTLLFAVRAAESAGDTESHPWKAIVVNWRTGEEIARFSVPPDTHNVDFLGNGSYIVADKARQGGTERRWLAESKRQGWIDEDRERLRHRIYVYNRTRNAVTWEYNFSDHFPETAGDGIDADFTHLNDVDVVANGSSILASPREFDRVF